ncbi:MAG: hypothetical protein ACREAU_05285 [Nitrosopumilaceae archaeon]
MKRLFSGFFFSIVLILPGTIRAAEVLDLTIGMNNTVVVEKYGKPQRWVKTNSGAIWSYTHPKLTVFVDRAGHVRGWIQAHAK